jgi:hypothetical protein
VGKGSFCNSVYALLAKRFHLYKRDKSGICCEVLVPALMTLFGLSLL